MPLTAEQDAFLRSMPHAIVGTIRRDGRPQLTPNWYYWNGDVFTVSTLSWTAKYKNLKRDPRVTLCIDGVERRTQYVQVFGEAEIVEGDLEGELRDLSIELIRKYEPDDETTRRHWESIKDDRVILRVRPKEWQWRYP